MQRPKVGLGVFVLQNGKFLMGKRHGAHGQGTWGLPGGHIEFGESFEECAAREVAEEVGVTIKNIRFLTSTNDVFEKEDKHYVTVYMIAEIDQGVPKIKEPDKMVALEWHSWQGMPSPLFLPLVNLKESGFNLQHHVSNSVFEHYKGNTYELVGQAKHSDSLEDFVVYKALYDSEIGKNVMWVRSKEDFYGKILRDGEECQRFKKIK